MYLGVTKKGNSSFETKQVSEKWETHHICIYKFRLTYLNGGRRSFGAEGFCLRGESEDGGRRSLSRRRSTTVGFQKLLRKEKLQCAWRRVTVGFKKLLRKEKLVHIVGYNRVKKIRLNTYYVSCHCKLSLILIFALVVVCTTQHYEQTPYNILALLPLHRWAQRLK